MLTEGAQTLKLKTLEDPIVQPTGGGAGGFLNAAHDHSNAANGGTLTNTAFGTGKYFPVSPATHYEAGTLAVAVLNAEYVAPFAFTLRDATGRVKTAPTGNTLICDVRINGASIFASQAETISIAAGTLFRGEGQASAIDYNDPVGLALGKSATLKNLPTRGHKPDTWYVYAARAVNGAGVLSPLSHHPVRVLTDGIGGIIDPPVPNPPSSVSARALPAGRAEVVIRYATQGQGVFPTDLRVFGRAVVDPHNPDTTGLYGTPLVDDTTGLTEIACRTRKLRYVFRVPAAADGTYWVFGAQFRNAGGVAATHNVFSSVIRIAASEPSKTQD